MPEFFNTIGRKRTSLPAAKRTFAPLRWDSVASVFLGWVSADRGSADQGGLGGTGSKTEREPIGRPALIRHRTRLCQDLVSSRSRCLRVPMPPQYPSVVLRSGEPSLSETNDVDQLGSVPIKLEDGDEA